MVKEVLQKILSDHQLWLSTDKKQGKRANLHYANLQNADLDFVNLKNANLYNANLQDASFQDANLSGVDLQNANLKGAHLYYVNLQYANLINANLNNTNLQGLDLNFTKGIIPFKKLDGRVCYAVEHTDCFMIKAGCFWGTLDKFEQETQEEYEDNSLQNYSLQIAYLRELWKQINNL